MKSFIVALALCVSVLAAAQTKVQFKTRQNWTSSRWYVLGQVRDTEIQWLGGSKTVFGPVPNECSATLKKAPKHASVASSDNEVLISPDRWIAVPVDPEKQRDSIAIFYTEKCKLNFPIKWSAGGSGGADVLTPFLFLNPQSNIYLGYLFDISAPASSGGTDILLDIVGGAWMMNLGNADAGAKSKIILAPVVQARGEWTSPWLGGLGFELHLLQGLASFGGVTNQSLLISEWLAGAYYQEIIGIGQGMVWRVHADFFQHLADEGTQVDSIGTYENNQEGLNFGLSVSQYFAKRWHVSMRGDYGLPSTMAGRGLKQSFWGLGGRIGYLVTDSVTWLVEGNYRSYGYEGFNSTTAFSGATGIRLEL